MAMESVPFSDLLRAPTEVIDRLRRARAVRLRRRDDADLVLMSADRADQEGQVVDLTARMLMGVLAREPHLVAEVLPTVLPWVRFLPDRDVEQLSTEFVTVIDAASGIGNLAPVAQLIVEWRRTAEIHADPELHQALTGSTLGDFGPVSKPDDA